MAGMASGRASRIARHVLGPPPPCTNGTAEQPVRHGSATAGKLTREHLDAFRADGFVRVPGVFSAEGMDRIEDELSRYIAEVMPSQPGPWDGKNHTCEVPGDLSTVWRISPVAVPHFIELAGGPLRELWEACFEQRAASVPTPQFFDKYPQGTKHTPAHQDGGFSLPRVLNGCTDMGNCVIVLDDMTVENGCLYYVRGSHRDQSGVSSMGALRRHEDGVVGFSRALADWSEDDASREVPMLAKRGDVIVHHCLVIHRAGVNSTPDKHRRSLGFSYQSEHVEMGPEIVNKGLVVNGRLVRGLYNDSAADSSARFADLNREELLQAITIWKLQREEPSPGAFAQMEEEDLRKFLREHAAL
jgi:phytanoyl-CoA hydroxylase